MAVARDPPGGCNGERSRVGHACDVLVAEQVRPFVRMRPLVSRLAAGEVGGFHMQRQVGPLAALDRGVAGVEVAAQDFGERVRSLPCRGAFFGGVVDRIPRFGQRGQCRQEHLAGDGVEVTFDRDAAVEGFRGVEFVAFGVFAGWEFVGFEDPLEPGDAGADGRGGRSGTGCGVQQHFPARTKRFVRHATRWGLAELPDQRRVLGRNIAGVERVGDLGLPAQHPAQCEDPCCGRHFQQRVRGQPLLDTAKSEGVERDCALVDLGDGGYT